MKNELFKKVTWRDVLDIVLMFGMAFMVLYAIAKQYYGAIAALCGIIVYNTARMERRIRELEKRLGDS